MSDTTQDRLAQIAQRVETATEGPWEHTTKEIRGSFGQSVKSVLSGMVVAFGGFGPRGSRMWADAEFIAHARTDIPAMHAALTAVLALHKNGGTWCTHCKVHRYPCPTVRAINDALGGE